MKIDWSVASDGELLGVSCHDGDFLGINTTERGSVKLNIRDDKGVDYLFHLTGTGVVRVNEFWEWNLIDCVCIYPVDTLSPELMLEIYKGRIGNLEDCVRDLKRHGAKYLLEVDCDAGAAAYVTFNELAIERV